MDEFEAYMKSQHNGKENAVFSKEIESHFGCKGTEIRRIVNELRSGGIPICSSTKGYYYSTKKDEIQKTITNLKNRITKIKAAMDGLQSCL